MDYSTRVAIFNAVRILGSTLAIALAWRAWLRNSRGAGAHWRHQVVALATLAVTLNVALFWALVLYKVMTSAHAGWQVWNAFSDFGGVLVF